MLRRGRTTSRRAGGEAYASPRWAVAQFVAAGLAAVLIISVGVVFVLRTSARNQAIRNARDITLAEGRTVLGGGLGQRVLDGDVAALRELHDKVQAEVLNDRIVRVKIWSRTGTIVYSDEGRLIGRTFPLGPDEQEALRSGRAHAQLSSLAEPENEFERGFHELLEVYVGLQTTGGQPVLFEAYLRYDPVAAEQRRLLIAIAPALIGGLFLLFLVQLPLALSLSRRARRAAAERERLMRRAVDAADHERARVASDLHDSVVQDVAGAAYALAGAADRAEAAGLQADASNLRTSAHRLRQSMRQLRTLIVAIAPPRLRSEGLQAALDDLVSPLSARGVHADLDITALPVMTDASQQLLFRAAQESIRNVISHANATNVRISLHPGSDHDVELTVHDDGRGFAARDQEREWGAGNHLGLTLLEQLVRDAGGSLTVESEPGQGTLVRIAVPSG